MRSLKALYFPLVNIGNVADSKIAMALYVVRLE